MSDWDKNSWEMLEVREMALRDLADFIPPNSYGTNKVTYSEIDYKLGKKLKLSSELEHINMTTRQRRAAGVLWKLGLCGFAAWKIKHTEEEGLRESMKERLVVLEADLPHFIKSYAECIPEEERKLLSILREENTNHQDTLKDSERNSLLKMIIGMAIEGYRYNPDASKNDAVSEITKDLEKLGISLSDDTIRKYLKMATAQLPRKPHQA